MLHGEKRGNVVFIKNRADPTFSNIVFPLSSNLIANKPNGFFSIRYSKAERSLVLGIGGDDRELCSKVHKEALLLFLASYNKCALKHFLKYNGN